MPFKVKDLLIELTSTTAQCHPTFICAHTAGCYNFCSHVISFCHAGCSIYAPSLCTFASATVTIHTCPGSLVTDTSPIFQTLPQLGGAALGNLKEQLKQALVLAEKQESAEADSLEVKTVADAELVEKKLTEALEEIRVRKAALQKQK